MLVPPPGHADDGKWATLPSGASIPSPSTIARLIPSRSILMRFAWIPGSPSTVGRAEAARAADPGGAVCDRPEGVGDPPAGVRLARRLDCAVGAGAAPPSPPGPP